MDIESWDDNKSYIRSTETLHVPYTTLPNRLRHFASDKADEEAVVFMSPHQKRVSVTYGELYQKSERFAKCLLKLGLGKGDVVAIADEMTSLWIIVTMAVQMTGAAPLHILLSGIGVENAQDILRRSNSKVLIMSPGHNDKQWQIVKDMITSVGKDGNVTSDVIPSLKRILLMEPRDGCQNMTYDKLLSDLELDENIKLPVIDPEDTAAIFLSSGTTGPPKLIPHTHFSMVISSSRERKITEGITKDILYNDRPFSWLGGYPHSLFHNGGKRVVCIGLEDLNSEEEINKMVFDTISAENCTTAVLMPPLISAILQDDDRDLFVNTVCSMALPIAAGNAQLTGRYCRQFLNAYAATELGVVAMNVVVDQNDFVSFDVGLPVPGVEIKVINFDGNLAEREQYGEVCARTITLSPGYLGKYEDFRRKVSATGWFRTGDIGMVTKQGHLILNGRIADALAINGIYYPSSIIECVVQGHPRVKQCVAVPVEIGDMPKVFCLALVFNENSDTCEEDVRKFTSESKELRDKVRCTEGRLLPRYYFTFESFPKLKNGKIARVEIKQACLQKIQKASTT